MNMGVYIPNWEKPKSCDDCWAEYAYEICNSHSVTCPLVSVPSHGRLIDADALLMRINHEVMESYMDGVCYGVHSSQEYLYLLGEIIDDAPTIIPASKEGK